MFEAMLDFIEEFTCYLLRLLLILRTCVVLFSFEEDIELSF